MMRFSGVFYLFEPLGISFAKLVDRLVECAYLAHKDKSESVFAFDSEILNKQLKGTKGMKK